MHQQQPRVHEIVGIDLEVVVDDVVLSHLYVSRNIVEEARVQVAGDHDTGWPDLRSKPAGNRARPGGDLEAAPTGPHADLSKTRHGLRVSRRLQGAQSPALRFI